MRNFIPLILVAMVFSAVLSAQDRDPKRARVYRRPPSLPLLRESEVDENLLETFALNQKANEGDISAMLELGYRYFVGRGIVADTLKGAQWIRRAADRGMPLAQYDMGLLAINGWGVRWNPFDAFAWFRAAADQGFADGQFATAINYSEDLVVNRNWPKTYSYLKLAADQGMEEAMKFKKELERRGLDKEESKATYGAGKKDSVARSPATPDSAFGFVFVDFHTDTSSTIPDSTIFGEAFRGSSRSEKNNLGQTVEAEIDTAILSRWHIEGEHGNPEALCALGKCYERGLGVKRDLLAAAACYVSAYRNESMRGPNLLWKLVQQAGFEDQLKAGAKKKDPNAAFVWAGLSVLQFSRWISEEQAFEMLIDAAAKNHVASMVELGLWFYTGRASQPNHHQARLIWKRAADMGSREAVVRLASSTLFEEPDTLSAQTNLKLLFTAAGDGSLVAQLALGYCYEKGIGVAEKRSEAYKLYHGAFLRGSQTAFQSLRGLYNDLRPKEQEFQLVN